MREQEWTIEHRKHGNEVYVVSSNEGIFVGEGYNKEERKRSRYLAGIIVEALNKAEEQDEKNKEGWTCIHCGQSTYENDYEQLFSAVEHIQCGLIAERESKKKNKESLID